MSGNPPNSPLPICRNCGQVIPYSVRRGRDYYYRVYCDNVCRRAYETAHKGRLELACSGRDYSHFPVTKCRFFLEHGYRYPKCEVWFQATSNNARICSGCRRKHKIIIDRQNFYAWKTNNPEYWRDRKIKRRNNPEQLLEPPEEGMRLRQKVCASYFVKKYPERKCNRCGKVTRNRMLCDECFREGENFPEYEHGVAQYWDHTEMTRRLDRYGEQIAARQVRTYSAENMSQAELRELVPSEDG